MSHTPTCKDWSNGTCPNGAKCVYPHYDNANVHWRSKEGDKARSPSLDGEDKEELDKLIAEWKSNRDKGGRPKSPAPKNLATVIYATNRAAQVQREHPLPLKNRYNALENDDEDEHPSPFASGTGQCEQQDTYPHKMCLEPHHSLCNCDSNSLASLSSSSIGELEEFLYENNDEDLCQECLGAGGDDGNDY